MLLLEDFDDIARRHGYASMYEAKNAADRAGHEELIDALTRYVKKHIAGEHTPADRAAIDTAIANLHI